MKHNSDEIKIQSTTDYSIFKQLLGNRPLNKGLLASLHQTIEEDGDFLKVNEILVNEKMEVIDGQHRLKVAEDRGIPIYYKIASGLRLSHARIFNSRKREWTARDYLHAYLTEGNRDAQILSDFMEEYKFSVAVSVRLLMKDSSAESMRKFRNGKFEIVDLTYAQDIAGLLSTLRDHSPDYAFAHAACIKAVMMMYEKMPDPKVFEKQLVKYGTTITRRVSPKDYLRQFQLILDMGGKSVVALL